MVWVNKVLWSREHSGECLIDLEECPLSSSNGYLRPSSMVEIIAQSIGFVLAHYHYHLKGQYIGFEKTFVAGYENVTFSSLKIQSDDTLLVKVKKIREVSTIAFVEGQITSLEKKTEICRGVLKLFSEFKKRKTDPKTLKA